MRKLTDEGLGTTGTYTFDGRNLFLHEDHGFPDGWLFGTAGDAACSASVASDTLQLTECLGSAGNRQMDFMGVQHDR